MRPLTHRIYVLGQRLGSGAEKVLRGAFDLGFSDYLALHGIATYRLSSQTELATFVGVTDAGISRIVLRLSARGLVKATEDNANRRRTLLTLTAKGSKLVQEAGARLEESFAAKAKLVASHEDLATFERVLDAIVELTDRRK